MKNIKKILLIILLTVFVLLLSSCSGLVQQFENKQIRAYTDTMINAILADDMDTAYSLVSDVSTEEEFSKVYKKVRVMLGDIESYELKLVSLNQKQNFVNGESSSIIDSVYVMNIDGQRYAVSVQIRSDVEKLSRFSIIPYEKTDLYYTDTVNTMSGASLLQWAFLLSNLLVIGFLAFAVIDCARHKIKLKPLWILIIILGAISFAGSISPTGINGNLNFFLDFLL